MYNKKRTVGTLIVILALLCLMYCSTHFLPRAYGSMSGSNGWELVITALGGAGLPPG